MSKERLIYDQNVDEIRQKSLKLNIDTHVFMRLICQLCIY